MSYKIDFSKIARKTIEKWAKSDPQMQPFSMRLFGIRAQGSDIPSLWLEATK